VHLDGARLWNAAAATGVSLADYAATADSLMVCLSKGLGAPVGSMLIGDAAFIAEAREARKMFGGGMRQVGVLAAPARLAIAGRARLTEDHARATALANGFCMHAGVSLPYGAPDTNIVFVRAEGRDASRIQGALAAANVLAIATGSDVLRFVTHLDVTDAHVARALEAFAQAVA
jgi:threonine aldolase